MFVEYFDDADDISQHVKAWDELALHASELNPFFESWSLLPALRHLDSEGVQVLIVWEDSSRQKMLGLMPVVVVREFRGLPIKRTTIWRHEYCFLSTPLVAKNCLVEVLEFMLNSIGESKDLPSFISMYWLAGECEIIPTLSEHVIVGFESKGKSQAISRAMVTTVGDYEKAFLPTLNKKKLKELRRNKNRLSEKGNLQTRLIDQNSSNTEIESAVQCFIELENQGWKREQGTAIACNKKHQRFFEESLLKGVTNGGAHIVKMTLDDETIAAIILIRSATGTHAYTVKIASDGDYQAYSLGSLLMLETTQLAFSNAEILQIDSCAAADHPMINRIWRERKDIVNVNITPDNDFRGAIIPMTDYCVGFAKRFQSGKK